MKLLVLLMLLSACSTTTEKSHNTKPRSINHKKFSSLSIFEMPAYLEANPKDERPVKSILTYIKDPSFSLFSKVIVFEDIKQRNVMSKHYLEIESSLANHLNTSLTSESNSSYTKINLMNQLSKHGIAAQNQDTLTKKLAGEVSLGNSAHDFKELEEITNYFITNKYLTENVQNGLYKNFVTLYSYEDLSVSSKINYVANYKSYIAALDGYGSRIKVQAISQIKDPVLSPVAKATIFDALKKLDSSFANSNFYLITEELTKFLKSSFQVIEKKMDFYSVIANSSMSYLLSQRLQLAMRDQIDLYLDDASVEVDKKKEVVNWAVGQRPIRYITSQDEDKDENAKKSFTLPKNFCIFTADEAKDILQRL